MSFLAENDRMIVMNSNEACRAYGLTYYSLSDVELKRLHEECGINVGLEQMYWSLTEPKFGQYDWSIADRQVERILRAGMKCILCTPMDTPSHLPSEWYWQTAQGHLLREGLSLWNADAQAYLIDFCQQCINRYSAHNVNVIYQNYLGGESVLHNVPCFFDTESRLAHQEAFGVDPRVEMSSPFILNPMTKEWLENRIIWHHLKLQGYFKTQFNEVWDALQPNIARQSWANGNYAQYNLHRVYTDTWPEIEQWIIFFTYFMHGGDILRDMHDLADHFPTKIVCEANYCEGLRDEPRTSTLAIKRGFRAQIVGPLSPWRQHTHMDEWMYDVIRIANEEWLAS